VEGRLSVAYLNTIQAMPYSSKGRSAAGTEDHGGRCRSAVVGRGGQARSAGEQARAVRRIPADRFDVPQLRERRRRLQVDYEETLTRL